MELLKKANGNIPRTEEEKAEMIQNAAIHYGNFLKAMGFDYEADENSKDTPTRVAKAWMNDIASGCVDSEPKMTSFPNNKYNGMVVQTFIPLKSLCSHHNLPISGFAHIAYIPTKDSKIIGLSKLNRITEFIAKRPQLQEAMTDMIHDMVNEKCEGNIGVAVLIQAKHLCTCHRGVHHNSMMSTMSVSRAFMDNEKDSKGEFLNHIKLNQSLMGLC